MVTNCTIRATARVWAAMVELIGHPLSTPEPWPRPLQVLAAGNCCGWIGNDIEEILEDVMTQRSNPLPFYHELRTH